MLGDTRLACNLLKQVSSKHELTHEVQTLLILEHLDHCAYIGVVQPLEHSKIAQKRLRLLLGYVCLSYNLDYSLLLAELVHTATSATD